MGTFQGAEGLMAAAGTLGRPADEYGNDSRVETLWAMKAMEQAKILKFSEKFKFVNLNF